MDRDPQHTQVPEDQFNTKHVNSIAYGLMKLKLSLFLFSFFIYIDKLNFIDNEMGKPQLSYTTSSAPHHLAF